MCSQPPTTAVWVPVWRQAPVMLRSGKRSLKRMRLVQAAGNGGAALDFDGQETPVGQFDDEVDLEAVEIAEVVEASKGCHSCRQEAVNLQI